MNLPITVVRDGLLVGRHTVISFNRTLRIPEDGKRYNLPAGFGRFPIIRVEDAGDRVPQKWREEGGVIIPLYQREALFLEFSGVAWRPTIAKVAVGGINAITGMANDLLLKSGRQDYVVLPEQRWLDGINAGNGVVRQFVAMPLGKGYTVEAQITDEEEQGGFQVAVFDPKEGVFSEPRQAEWKNERFVLRSQGISLGAPVPDEVEMGIAVGGSINQQIFEDSYGVHTWNARVFGRISIHIVNSAVYAEITGRPTPPSPIGADVYERQGIPWFKYYDESRKAVSGPTAFQKLLSVFQVDRARDIASVRTSPSMNTPPPLIIRTPTVSERLEETMNSADLAFRQGRYLECFYAARTSGELIEGHIDELRSVVFFPLEQAAADSFSLAGESCAQIGMMDQAEGFANRSLMLKFSERALALRLQARLGSSKWKDAEDDCADLLRENPSHDYARQVKTFLQNRVP